MILQKTSSSRFLSRIQAVRRVVVGQILPMSLVAVLLCAPAHGAVDPDGSYSDTIPIKLPIGTTGMHPELALTYDSNAGNGIVGVGWDLEGISSITRINTGNGIKYAGADSYAHSIAGELVNIGGGVYHSQRETFMKFVPSGTCGDGPCQWEAINPNGFKAFYGTNIDSRIEAVGEGMSVRVWALNEVRDLHGNSYKISYTEDTTNGDFYPLDITYTHGTGILQRRTVQFEYEARSDHGPTYSQNALEDIDKRLKAITILSMGFQVREYVLNYDNSPSSNQSRLISVQELGRQNGSLPAQTFTYSGVAEGAFSWQGGVNTMTRTGAGIEDLKGDFTNLHWGDFNGDGKSDVLVQEKGLWDDDISWTTTLFFANGDGSFSMASRDPNNNVPGLGDQKGDENILYLGDFNGDGKTDILKQEKNNWDNDLIATTHVYLSKGDGTFVGVGAESNSNALWRFPAHSIPHDLKGDETDLFLADFNADGKTDVLYQEKNNWDNDHIYTTAVFFSDGDGTFTQGNVTAGNNAIIHTGGNITPLGDYTNLFLGDFDGDGKADVLVQEAHPDWISDSLNTTTLHFSKGDGTFRDVSSQGNHNALLRSWLQTQDLKGGRVILHLADFNGDGQTDVLTQEMADWDDDFANTTNLFFSRGDGTFADGPRGADNNVPGLGDLKGDNTLLFVTDFHGDGKADVLAQPRGNISMHTGYGDGRFILNNMPYFLPNDQAILHLFDDDGDGRVDFLKQEKAIWDDDASFTTGLWRPNGPLADLLISANNGIGATVTVEYEPAPQLISAVVPNSTHCGGGSGAVCGVPDPSPRPLVTKLTVNDGNQGVFSHSFGYYNGRFYPGTLQQRTGLGFQMFLDTEDATGVVNVVSFRQDKPFHGRASASNVYVMDTSTTPAQSKKLDEVNLTYDVVYPYTGTELVRQSQEETLTYNLGTLAFKGMTSLFYDDYGNITWKGESGDGVPTVWTEIIYQNDTANWILGRVLEIKTQSPPTILAHTKNTYTDNNLTQKHEWLKTNDSWIRVAEMTYDPNGNLKQVTGPPTPGAPAGSVTRIEYDPVFNAYAAKLINALGHETQTQYDLEGLPFREIDANQKETQTERDEFGRVKKITRPDGGWTAYRYLDYGDVTRQRNETEILADGLKTVVKRELFDGTNFVYMTVSTGDAGKVIVTERRKDAAGRLWKESLPYFAGTTPRWTIHEYDGAGRQSKVTPPSISGILCQNAACATTFAYGTGTVTLTAPNNTATTVNVQTVSTTDTNNHTLVQKTDARGKLVAVTDERGYDTFYGYDELGRLVWVRLADNSYTTIAYDSLNRRTSITEPNTGTKTFEYDAEGSILRQTDAKGQIINFTYDALNRVTLKDLPGTEPDVTYTYDAPLVLNSKGRLTQRTDASGTRQLSYDVMGRVATDRVTIDGEDYFTSANFDIGGRLTRLDLPDGNALEYTYHDSGNPAKVRLRENTVWKDMAEWGVYTAAALPQSLSYLNGVTTTFTYDEWERLKHIYALKGPNQIQNLDYTIDGVGNVLQIKDQRQDKTMITASTVETAEQTTDPITAKDVTSNSALVPAFTIQVPNRAMISWTLTGSDDSTNCVAIKLVRPDGSTVDLKPAGTPDPGFKDLFLSYNGPGQYRIRLHEKAGCGGTSKATLSGVTMTVVDEDAVWPDETMTYTYDESDFLTKADGPAFTGHYQVDAVGNLKQKEGKFYTYQGQRVSSATNDSFGALYDLNGNMFSKTVGTNTWTYSYTSEDRVKEVKKAGILRAQMVYADDGTRMKHRVYTSGGQLSTTILYINPSYEVRKLANGRILRTIHVMGNGHIVASHTYEAPLTTQAKAEQQSRTYLALATMTNGAHPVGFFKKAALLLLGYANHPGAAEALMTAQCWVVPILFSALFLGGLWQAKRLRKTTRFRSEYGYGARFSALTVLVSFTLAVLMFGAGNMAEAALAPPPPGGIGLGKIFYHANHLGSSSVVTDENGVVKSRLIYKPYGEIIGGNGYASGGEDLTPYKFTGEERDRETGLYYLGARFYDPAIGRFLTADSIVPGATDPAAFNRYAYARNNPIVYTDPTGHGFFSKIFKKIKHAFKKVIGAVKTVVKAVFKATVQVVKAVVKAHIEYYKFLAKVGKGIVNNVRMMIENPQMLLQTGLSFIFAMATGVGVLLWAVATFVIMPALNVVAQSIGGIPGQIVVAAIAVGMAAGGMPGGIGNAMNWARAAASMAVRTAVTRGLELVQGPKLAGWLQFLNGQIGTFAGSAVASLIPAKIDRNPITVNGEVYSTHGFGVGALAQNVKPLADESGWFQRVVDQGLEGKMGPFHIRVPPLNPFSRGTVARLNVPGTLGGIHQTRMPNGWIATHYDYISPLRMAEMHTAQAVIGNAAVGLVNVREELRAPDGRLIWGRLGEE